MERIKVTETQRTDLVGRLTRLYSQYWELMSVFGTQKVGSSETDKTMKEIDDVVGHIVGLVPEVILLMQGSWEASETSTAPESPMQEALRWIMETSGLYAERDKKKLAFFQTLLENRIVKTNDDGNYYTYFKGDIKEASSTPVPSADTLLRLELFEEMLKQNVIVTTDDARGYAVRGDLMIEIVELRQSNRAEILSRLRELGWIKMATHKETGVSAYVITSKGLEAGL